MRCHEFLRNFFLGIPNFGIGIPISQFFNSGIRENFPTGIFGIENGIGILLLMGVPEIGTKNWNSQPRYGLLGSIPADMLHVSSTGLQNTCLVVLII
jgi:hypothetical protein